MVFLNLMATLLLRATLFLFKSATFDSTYPIVSVHKHYLKWKHYGSQYAGYLFCLEQQAG